MKCKFCGKENENKKVRCVSCNALLPRRSNLSEKDYSNLSNYIKSLEKTLKTAKRKSNGVTSSFLTIFLFIFTAAGKYAHNNLIENKTTGIILMIMLAVIIFAAFRSIMLHFEEKAMLRKYYGRLIYNIEDYLRAMNYKTADIKTVANDVLKKKSYLLKYLRDFDMLPTLGFQYKNR